jgi:hypothetical protein
MHAPGKVVEPRRAYFTSDELSVITPLNRSPHSERKSKLYPDTITKSSILIRLSEK